MGNPILPDDLLTQIADLERRIRILESTSRLALSSIKEGALQVLDSNGVVRVKIGKDGTDYGVKVFDAAGANAVQLATLAFGPNYDQVDPEESTTSTSFTDLATVGPTVTATIGPIGKAIVLAGAYMTSTVTNQTVVTALSIDGGAPIDMADLGNNSSGSIAASCSGAWLATGLSPGSHQFRLKYLQSLGGATGRFAGRWVLVLPY